MRSTDPVGSTRPVALVTGASKGLGATVARFLAAEGYDLVVCARHGPELERAARDWRARGGRVLAVAADLADPADRARVVEAVRSLGSLELLVNNASELGVSPLLPLDQFPLQELPRVFEVNVTAPLALLQQLLPLFPASGGLVVNISSDAAVAGYPGWGVYGSSKAALDLLSVTLAHELADRRISVASVDPGDMRTDLHQSAYPGQDISDRPLPESTVPFWAWLFGQDPMRVTAGRFRAQSDHWELTA